MFAVFCLLLLLLLRLGHCQDDLPTRYEVESSINRTIEEVERQIRENPSLPRLSRADIVRALQNITSQDLKHLKDKEKLEKARNLYQRALMVVLPYNGESENLNVLYTKPPMTQLIPDNQKSENRGDEKDNEVQNSEITTENFYNRDSHKNALNDLTTTSRNRYKNHKDTYSEVQTKIPLKETLKLDSTPVKFTFNLENLQKNSYTTEREASTTRYPVYRSNGSTPELEIVYSTSVTEATTKPAPKVIAIDLGKSKEKQNILTSSQWRYNAPPATIQPTLPSKLDKIPFLPTINVKPEEHVASTKKSVNEALIMSTEKPTTLYVTPMPVETTTKTRYSSTYSLNSAGFRQAVTTSTTSMPMRPEVMDLLASIGLRPDNSSNVEDVYKKNKDILELSNLRSTVSGLTPVATDSVSIVDQNTFESPGSEIKKGVDNLSRDVQLLFKKFGLQTSDFDKSTSTTQRTTVNLNSYTNFKPLPTSSVKDEELKAFLARFGLIGDNRKQKSMRPTTEAPSVIEAVPGNMRGILENIGLISRKRKTVVDSMEDTKSTDSSKFHVFKPHEASVQDEEQKSKINELLDTVKLMQEGKAGIQNVKQAADQLLQSTKILKEGPDPLKLEEIIKTYEEDARNEVKREEEEEKSETTTVGDEGQTTTVTESAGETTLSPTTTTTTTATDSAKAASDQLNSATGIDSSTTSTTSANLMALEESFGGTTKAPDTALPPRRKSGLYFLVDWNTFLEVGEDEKEKVNLRFQPKVGDRSRFLPVTIP